MKTTLNDQTFYNTVIIGGGIVGAGIFRDLALHGVDTLLIDSNDFSSQTSQSSSKMLHGGIRYLENHDFALVKEALHEKNTWAKLLPHLAKEKPFILPIYKDSKHPKWMIKSGLFLYDLLSGFQNKPHRMLTREQLLSQEPLLCKDNLIGAGIYHDALMDDVKITLEVIYDALKNKNCMAKNYLSFQSMDKEDENTIKLTLKDTITQDIYYVRTKNIIFAVGPFTDVLLNKVYPKTWDNILLPSKGSHIRVDNSLLNIKGPLVINTNDGRVVFFIPNQQHTLIGTTEVPLENEEIKNLRPSKLEIEYLIQVINEYFPNAKIEKKHIQSSFAGVRPLVKESNSENRGKTARVHKCYYPEKNVYVIAGGKYTTFRTMGQEISRQIVLKNGEQYNSLKSLSQFSQKSIIYPFSPWRPNYQDVENILEHEMPRTFEDLIYRRVGIFSKNQWRCEYPEIDFDLFFTNLIPLISRKFSITKDEIISYRDS